MLETRDPFYALFPILLTACLGRSRRALLWIAAAACAASLVLFGEW